MAVIQLKDPDVHAIGHDGVEYQTQGDGLFEVPHDVATLLVKNAPHSIRLYDGLPWPRQKTAAELEAERIASLVHSAMSAASEPAPAAPEKARAPRKAKKAAVKKAPATSAAKAQK